MGQRPKRRKKKDNPYILDYYEDKNAYIISFKDGKGVFRVVQVAEEVYKLMDRFELDDLSELNEYDNHIEHSEVFEESLYKRAMEKPVSLEDSVIQQSTFEELKKAINCLSEIQKRRIKKYYFDDKTEYEIAKEENATQQSVHISLERAREKLKEILKNSKI